jgi:hypothetical protein
MSFVMHETVYFGRCLPWVIIDMIPYFRRWKIQDVSLMRPVFATTKIDLQLDQDSNSRRAMALHQVGTANSFHNRITANLVVSSFMQVLWNGYWCSIPALD